MTTTMSANTSIISHSYHFFFAVRAFKIYSLSNFQVGNRVLLIIIIPYFTSPEIILKRICDLEKRMKDFHFLHLNKNPFFQQIHVNSYIQSVIYCYIIYIKLSHIQS